MQHEGARTGPAGTARRLLRAALGCVDWTVTMRGMVVLGVPFASVTAVAGLRHGVFAALGAYSDAYGSREPYARRLLVLTVTAAGFVTALVLGMLAARDPWLSVAAIAVIATAGDFGTGALRMSGPRGYIFTLVGALAVFLPYAPGEIPADVGCLLVGVASAVLGSMSGVLRDPSAPERRVVSAAFGKVADLVAAIGEANPSTAQHTASTAVSDAWSALGDALPPGHRRPRDPRRLRLYVLTRRLEDIEEAAQDRAGDRAAGPVPEDWPEAVRALAAATGGPLVDVPALSSAGGGAEHGGGGWAGGGAEGGGGAERSCGGAERHGTAAGGGAEHGADLRLRTAIEAAARSAAAPDAELGDRGTGGSATLDEALAVEAAFRPLVRHELRRSLSRASPRPPVALRTGAAVAAASALGELLPLTHPSWSAIGAAGALEGGKALVVTRRVGLRLLGTLAGVAVTAAVFHAYQPGTWVVVGAVTLLHGLSRSVIVRNLAFGTTLITPIALMLAYAGAPGTSLGALAAARLVDMSLGLAVGLVAEVLLVHRRLPMSRMSTALSRALRAEGRELALRFGGTAGPGEPSPPDPPRPRNIQSARTAADQALVVLAELYGATLVHARRGDAAERVWPLVLALRRLGPRGAAGRGLVPNGQDPTAASVPGAPSPGPDPDGSRVRAFLDALATTVESGTDPRGPVPPALPGKPGLRRCLVALPEAAAVARTGGPS